MINGLCIIQFYNIQLKLETGRYKTETTDIKTTVRKTEKIMNYCRSFGFPETGLFKTLTFAKILIPESECSIG